MKKILLFLLAAAVACLMLSVSAQSGTYDAHISSQVDDALRGLLQTTIKDMLGGSPPFPLPQGASLGDIKIDVVYACYSFEGDSIRKTHSFDTSGSDPSYFVTTTVMGTPYIGYGVGKNTQGSFYVATVGNDAALIAAARTACQADGNIPANVIYSFSERYLLGATPQGQKLAYAIDELAAGFIGGRCVSLDRLRYDYEVAAYYYEKTGAFLNEADTIPTEFIIPSDIPVPTDYTAPAPTVTSSAASAGSTGSTALSDPAESVQQGSSGDIILWVGAAIGVLLLGSGAYAIFKRKKKE